MATLLRIFQWRFVEGCLKPDSIPQKDGDFTFPATYWIIFQSISIYFNHISIIFQSYFNHISIIFQSYFNLFQSISIYFNLFHMMLLQCVLRFYLLTPMLRSSWVLDFRPERVQFVKVQDQKVAKFKMGRSVMISPSSPSSISSVSQISIHVATDHGVYSPWVNSGHFGEKRVPGPRCPVPPCRYWLQAWCSSLPSSARSQAPCRSCGTWKRTSQSSPWASNGQFKSPRAMDGSEM